MVASVFFALPAVVASEVGYAGKFWFSSFFLFVVTTSHHRCSVANVACFRWSYADNFGVLARGANCTNVHLACLIAGVQKACLDVHDISLASGSADVARFRSVARTVSSRRRTAGRAVELGNGHESFFAGEPWSTVRGIQCLLRSDWSVQASRSRFVKDVVSWPGRLVVSRKRQGSREAPRSIRARLRALRSIAPEAGLECPGSDEDVVSLAQRESCADFPELSLQLLNPSEWRLAACGGFCRHENITVLEACYILYAVRYAESSHSPGRLLILTRKQAKRSMRREIQSQVLRCFAMWVAAMTLRPMTAPPSGWTETDELVVALGCRFALDVFTVIQQDWSIADQASMLSDLELVEVG